ncbi:MAG: hypothetical protein LBG79_08160 [Spirochaetaceae bacterium]|jgi:hypothetical protein|nr:hypothetical protein [Spirochaetaceae bacterium]GMO27435.1 MAG: hypothetical protein Pg6A_15000 [Termitinemataceae bacterium]
MNVFYLKRGCLAFLLLIVVHAAVFTAENEGEKKIFPAIYRNEKNKDKLKNSGTPAGADTEEEAKIKKEREEQAKKLFLNAQSILLNNDIVAYYGHPNSKGMGILGRMSKENLLKRLEAQAEEYKAVSGGRNIIKAFYIIYGTVQPEGRIGYIGDARLKEYIDFAAENDMLVFLDHQIGKYDPIASLQLMLPYLKEYSNVHLALDPEWRTTKPMQEIGSVSGEEINRAQEVMQKYIIDNEISGERLLVIHQFNAGMINNRKAVKADFERVRLVLCMDGHGTPAKKRGSYEYNALATNIPVKAFKLFYNEKGNTGVDEPILTPKQVYELQPRPMLIMYQ